MKIKEAMHKGVEWVSPNTPVTMLAKKMRQFDIGAIPVGENDRLIGMVTDRDITLRGLGDGKDVSRLTARDVMTKRVIYCRESEDVERGGACHGKQVRAEAARSRREQEDGRHAQPWRHFACGLAENRRRGDEGGLGPSA